jgi:ElaB/YqjD/DUF883 family membrane-anchored ribosome-binding protein
MAENETESDAPAKAAPKKPRATRAVNGTGKVAASTKSATGTPKRKPAARKTDAALKKSGAKTASTAEQTPTPNSAVLVSTGVAGAGTAAAAATGAFDSVTEKVSAMIPDDMGAKAKDVAEDVKVMACDAVAGLARIIGDSAGAIDDNVGPQYGDYARSAAQSVNDAADRLRSKPVEEIAEDTREFVRTRPVAAAGIAAVASLVLARIFGSIFGKRR